MNHNDPKVVELRSTVIIHCIFNFFFLNKQNKQLIHRPPLRLTLSISRLHEFLIASPFAMEVMAYEGCGTIAPSRMGMHLTTSKQIDGMNYHLRILLFEEL